MIGNYLQNIPVLHNFPILIESKDVDSCVVAVPGPLLVAMQHDVIAFGYCTFERDLFVWKHSRQSQTMAMMRSAVSHR